MKPLDLALLIRVIAQPSPPNNGSQLQGLAAPDAEASRDALVRSLLMRFDLAEPPHNDFAALYGYALI